MMEAYLEQTRRWVPARSGSLRAVQGRLWLTRDGEWDDHLLLPGQSIALRGGQAVTAGPWQDDEAVRLQVCTQAPASRLGRWLSAGVGLSLQAVAQPAQAVSRWALAAARRHGSLGDLGC
jgi:hypothetical protein